MKAAVLYESPGKLKIEDIVIDEPQPNEIVIQIAASGLCHSDLHWLDRGYPMTKPIVLGHEGAGIVAQVGSEVSKVKVGDHVIAYNLGHLRRNASGASPIARPCASASGSAAAAIRPARG